MTLTATTKSGTTYEITFAPGEKATPQIEIGGMKYAVEVVNWTPNLPAHIALTGDAVAAIGRTEERILILIDQGRQKVASVVSDANDRAEELRVARLMEEIESVESVTLAYFFSGYGGKSYSVYSIGLSIEAERHLAKLAKSLKRGDVDFDIDNSAENVPVSLILSRANESRARKEAADEERAAKFAEAKRTGEAVEISSYGCHADDLPKGVGTAADRAEGDYCTVFELAMPDGTVSHSISHSY